MNNKVWCPQLPWFTHCEHHHKKKSSDDNAELGKKFSRSFQKTYKLLSAEGIKLQKEKREVRVPKMNRLTGWEIKLSPYVRGTWVSGSLESSSIHSSVSENSLLAGGANMDSDSRRYLDLSCVWEHYRGNSGLGDNMFPSHLLSAAMGYSGGHRKSHFRAPGSLDTTSHLQSASAL